MWPDFIEGSHHKIIAKKFNQLASGEIKRLIVIVRGIKIISITILEIDSEILILISLLMIYLANANQLHNNNTMIKN